jgi:hypothetical protein
VSRMRDDGAVDREPADVLVPVREQIERHIPDLMPHIAEACRLFRCEIGDWPQKAFAITWLDMAVDRACIEALRKRRARSYTAARRLVCGEMGLDVATVKQRYHRARRTPSYRARDAA